MVHAEQDVPHAERPQSTVQRRHPLPKRSHVFRWLVRRATGDGRSELRRLERPLLRLLFEGALLHEREDVRIGERESPRSIVRRGRQLLRTQRRLFQRNLRRRPRRQRGLL
jgi:hypothetical protein